jgi:murein DD-endopeptidase MepM/ murein hydrolase activator NlpD
MRLFLGLQVSHSASRIAMVGAAAMLLAGCSSDSTRLADLGVGGRSNSDLMPTASIPANGQQSNPYSGGAPTMPVRSQPLAPISSRPLAAPNPSLSAPATPSPQLSARHATVAAPATTASTTRAASAAGWSAEGGTPVVVAQGETVPALSARYGVPTDALLRANGYTSAAQVTPGTRLVVPVYNASARAAATAVHAPVAHAAKPVAAATKPIAAAQPLSTAPAQKLQMVRGPAPAAQTVATAAPARPGKPAPAVTEAKPPKAAAVELKPAKVAAAEVKPAPAKAVEAKVEAPAKVAPAPQKVAAIDPKKVAAPAVDRDTTTASVPPQAAAAPAEADKPEFRWPARGRVIQGFKPGANDGINIAVPEGTSVKAAEAGVVAYAGSELKGYGNLVLIRHPNGYVSAYANNGEINVKRGDQIKRGQIIAKSGQTGNVSSPQIHFELRKGSTPVDPSGYLPAN